MRQSMLKTSQQRQFLGFGLAIIMTMTRQDIHLGYNKEVSCWNHVSLMHVEILIRALVIKYRMIFNARQSCWELRVYGPQPAAHKATF